MLFTLAADHACFGWLAGLTGQIMDVPFAITSNMLIMQLQDTSLQNKCAEPSMCLPSCLCITLMSVQASVAHVADIA